MANVPTAEITEVRDDGSVVTKQVKLDELGFGPDRELDDVLDQSSDPLPGLRGYVYGKENHDGKLVGKGVATGGVVAEESKPVSKASSKTTSKSS
jgi:hypothetical protein